MANLTLEIVEGPDAGKQIELQAAIEIGRDPDAGLTLNDTQASRRHARLTPEGDGAIVEDLGSSNGTFVNHQEVVSPTRVTAGDELLIGVTILQLRSQAEVAVQASAVRAVPTGLAIPPQQPSYVDRLKPGAGAPQAPGEKVIIPELERLTDARTKMHARLAPLAMVLLVALVVAIYFGTKGTGSTHAARAVYTTTNNGDANQLLVYSRAKDGSLKLSQTLATGGKGGLQPEPGCDPPDHKCPVLDTQNPVLVTGDGKLVFAVNAGSNTITSFRVGKSGSVTNVGSVGSEGVFPNSLAIHGSLLYVLNNNSESIAGFKFSDKGELTAIPGSTQKLTPQHAPLSRQIGFDNSGKLLLVNSLTDARFDVFTISDAGVAGKASPQPTASPEPFAFAFTPNNQLVSVEVVDDTNLKQFSNQSSYSLSSDGKLTKISVVPTQGYAGCWTVVTKDGKWVFTVNTGGPSPYGSTVTSFAASSAGALTFSSLTPKSGYFTLTDEALSHDDKYLYVVTPLIANPFTKKPLPNGSKILTFRVGSDGKLTKVSETTEPQAPGMSGIAAY